MERIAFSEYMRRWLYGPGGYYSRFKAIGKEGDFYTAVSTSRFFGATIAHAMIDKIRRGELPADLLLLEIGAHQGYLLGDMIEWIAQEAPAFLPTMRFGIVERFESLRKSQRDYFARRFGEDVKLEHFGALEEVEAEAVYAVANEIFDAFPCDLHYRGKTALVDLQTHEVFFEGEDEEVLALAKRYGQPKGEVARGYEAFALAMAKMRTKKLCFITFDYGEKEARTDFSLRIYHKHQVYPFFEEGLDRSKLFGVSDLTYDVNFSHLFDAFEGAGFKWTGYATQLRALTEMGLPELLEMLAKLGDRTLYMRELNKIKTLIDPQLMGERFKMAAFEREER